MLGDASESLELVQQNMPASWSEVEDDGTSLEWIPDGKPYKRLLDGKMVWAVNVVEHQWLQVRQERLKQSNVDETILALCKSYREGMAFIWNAPIEEVIERFGEISLEEVEEKVGEKRKAEGGPGAEQQKASKRIRPDLIGPVGSYTPSSVEPSKEELV